MVTILRYAPDADEDAGRYIGWLINHPGRAADDGWMAVLADDRVEQTHRALRALEESARNQVTRLRATSSDTDSADYLEARSRVLYFRECVVERLRVVNEARADMRRRVTAAQNAERQRSAVGVLAVLVDAVATHRATTEHEFEPTTADRLLWARLELLRLDDGSPIMELIKRSAINPEPQPGDQAGEKRLARSNPHD